MILYLCLVILKYVFSLKYQSATNSLSVELTNHGISVCYLLTHCLSGSVGDFSYFLLVVAANLLCCFMFVTGITAHVYCWDLSSKVLPDTISLFNKQPL